MENEETTIDFVVKAAKKMLGHGTLLTKWDEDIIKVITSLENRGILLKGISEKAIHQTGGYLSSNVLGSLMRVSLPLMKNVLTQLAKRVLVPLGLTVAGSATDAAIFFFFKLWIGHDYIDNLK